MKRSSIFLIFVLVCSGTLRAQSLADFARQERERQKNTESKVTLTNDSVRPAPAAEPELKPEVQSEVKDAAKEQKPAANTPAAEVKPVRDEKYWRGAFAQAREELHRAEMQVKVQEIRLSQAHKDLLMKSDLYNKEQLVGAELNAANADLEAARLSVERSKQKISALEEDLRRSGGPAGWAR